MTSSAWTNDGLRYDLEWGGRRWTLDLGSARPGLVDRSTGAGPILGLEAVLASGTALGAPFGPDRLVAHDRRFDRVEAVYDPTGTGSLRLRAAWTPVDARTIDLEVQIQAYSVGEWSAVEVVLTCPATDDDGRVVQWVHPDDVSRRNSTATALFGHDLERGVVVRGRVRCVAFDPRPTPAAVEASRRAFLDAPPPLGP